MRMHSSELTKKVQMNSLIKEIRSHPLGSQKREGERQRRGNWGYSSCTNKSVKSFSQSYTKAFTAPQISKIQVLCSVVQARLDLMVSERCSFSRWQLCPGTVFNLAGRSVVKRAVNVNSEFVLSPENNGSFAVARSLAAGGRPVQRR